MSKNILLILLNFIGFITLVVWLVTQLKELSKLSFKSFVTWRRFKYPLLLLLIIGVPVLIVNYTSLFVNKSIVENINNYYYAYCVIIAFLISMVWLRYILKLDIYEKEKWYHVCLIFVLSFNYLFINR